VPIEPRVERALRKHAVMIAQRLEAPARMKSQFADPSPLIAIIHIEDIHAASIPTSAMYLAPATPADPTTWTLTIEQ